MKDGSKTSGEETTEKYLKESRWNLKIKPERKTKEEKK